MAHLTANSYGKQRVLLTKIVRDGETHHVHEYAVEIALYGEFEQIYTEADNAACIPTDTMKNTVYAIARQTAFSSPEELGVALTNRFIERFSQVHAVDVEIEASVWRRIEVDGRPHPHSFEKEHTRRTSRVTQRRSEGSGPRLAVGGGLRGMEVFKSSGSGFTGFTRDEYTTLPETTDRILATSVDATWKYAPSVDPAEHDFAAEWETIHAEIARVFAEHDSPSLQATLFEMGTAVLAASEHVDSISFTMPNQHHIRFDLSAFGLDNPNEVFYGTDSPFGVIRGTVAREEHA